MHGTALTNSFLPLLIIAPTAAIIAFQPDFVDPVLNISVASGRDATFTCHVRHLGGYRVSSPLNEIILSHKSRNNDEQWAAVEQKQKKNKCAPLPHLQVGWVKADTKAIQAIHEQVITHNPRVSVSHTDATTWNLHIKAVSEEDSGGYMCQLNTDPMKSQVSGVAAEEGLNGSTE